MMTPRRFILVALLAVLAFLALLGPVVNALPSKAKHATGSKDGWGSGAVPGAGSAIKPAPAQQAGKRQVLPNPQPPRGESDVGNGGPGRVLLVSSLDGRITAMSARTGQVLWSVQTGGPMVDVRAGNMTSMSADATADGQVPPSSSSALSQALIIPSRDGGILLRTPGGGMQQLPYRAQDLVQSLPMSAGGNILVGSKTTRAIQVNLLTGRVMRSISGHDDEGDDGGDGSGGDSSIDERQPLHPIFRKKKAKRTKGQLADGATGGEEEDEEDEEEVPPPLPSGIHFGSPLKPPRRPKKGGKAGDGDAHEGTDRPAGSTAKPTPTFGPSIWLGRSDFLVKAFSPGADRHLWNLTYGELASGSSLLVVDGPPLPVAGSSGSSSRTPSAATAANSNRPIYFEGETVVAAHASTATTTTTTSGQRAHQHGSSTSSHHLVMRLAAHMTGEIFATHADTGAFLWQSPPLYAPVLQVHAVTVNADGTASHAHPVPFAEVWPAGRALAGSAASASGGRLGPASQSQDAEPSPSDLFVGMLSSGQLFALPRSPRTVLDTSADPSAYWSSVFAAVQHEAALKAIAGRGNGDRRGAGAGSGSPPALPMRAGGDDVLLLPAPDGDREDGELPDDRAVVVAPPRDRASRGKTGRDGFSLDHCDVLDVSSTGDGLDDRSSSSSSLFQCLLVGLHNVSYVGADGKIYSGWRGDSPAAIAAPTSAGGARRQPPPYEDDSSWGTRLGLPDGRGEGDRRPNGGRGLAPPGYHYYWNQYDVYRDDDYDEDRDLDLDLDGGDDNNGRRSGNRGQREGYLSSHVSLPLAQWLHNTFSSSSSVASRGQRSSSIKRLATLLDNLLVAGLSTTTTIMAALAVYYFCLKGAVGVVSTGNKGKGAAAKAGRNNLQGANAASSAATIDGVASGGGVRGNKGGGNRGKSKPEIDPNAAAAASNASSALSPPSSTGSQQAQQQSSSTAAADGPLVISNTTTPTVSVVDGVEYRVFGRLAVSDKALGYGCHGTVVFKGLYDKRPVAVKRLLKTFHPHVSREISLLIRTDNHPHVVRYYACEEGAADFIYLALELCEATLADAMAKAASKRKAKMMALMAQGKPKGKASSNTASPFAALANDDNDDGGNDPSDKKAGKKKQTATTASSDDTFALSSSFPSTPSALNNAPVPCPATRLFLRHLVSGVAHLHAHRIVHRDLKPHNILLAKVPTPAGGAANANVSNGGAGSGGSSSTAAGGGSAGHPWWFPLYPTELEGHQLGLHYAPKISDFGLGKQLESGDDDGSTMGYRRGGNAAVGGLAGAGGDGTASSLFIQRHGGGHGGNRPGVTGNNALAIATAAVGAGSSSSAVAPGSLGWQAPEVLSAVIKLRGGSLPFGSSALSGAGSTPSSPEHKGTPGAGSAEADAATSVPPEQGTDSTPAVISGDDEDKEAADAAERQRAGTDTPTTSATATVSTVVTHSTNSNDERWRKSRSADVWALACVLYHVLDPGRHPYGESFDREANIIRGKLDLSRLDNASPEAQHLLSMMLHQDPNKRPSASMCLEHPFFWDDEKRMAFLQDFSDRVDQEPSLAVLAASPAGANATAQCLRTAVEAKADFVFEGLGSAASARDWSRRLPQSLVNDGGKYRAYDTTSLCDCLRLLRNKRNHYHALPLHIRRDLIGSEGTPAALVPFFLHPTRFPRLLLAAYEVAMERLSHEPQFAVSYVGHITAAKHAARAAAMANKASQAIRLAMGADAAAAAAAGAKSAVPTLPASSAVAAPPAAAQRGWYLSESEWDKQCTEQCQRVVTEFGGRLVTTTLERTDESGPGASKTPYGAYPGPAATKAAADAAEALAAGKVMVVAAHSGMKETDFRGGAHSFHLRYKSIPCKDFDGLKGQRCPRGVRCDFAHGPIELRVRPQVGGGGAAGRRFATAPIHASEAGGDATSATPAEDTGTPSKPALSFAQVAASASTLLPPAPASTAPPAPVKPEEVLADLSLLLDLKVSGLPPIYPPR